MLHAFKAQLKTLAKEPQNSFHKEIRKRIGKRATALLEKRLRQLILITPDIIERVHVFWRQFPKEAPARRISGYLLTYLYHPTDFLSEDKHGLFGYLDDAYFAALVYENVLGEVKESGHSLSLTDRRFLKDVANMKAAAKLVIPDESKKIDALFNEIQTSGESEVYASAFAS